MLNDIYSRKRTTEVLASASRLLLDETSTELQLPSFRVFKGYYNKVRGQASSAYHCVDHLCVVQDTKSVEQTLFRQIRCLCIFEMIAFMVARYVLCACDWPHLILYLAKLSYGLISSAFTLLVNRYVRTSREWRHSSSLLSSLEAVLSDYQMVCR